MANKIIYKKYFLVVGANHRSSTMLFRDKLAIKDRQLTNVYDRLLDAGIRQSFVLSTKDRTEIYAFHDPLTNPASEIIKLLSSHAGVGRGEIEAQTYVLTSGEAFRHLLAVCCALDSLVIGDPRVSDILNTSYNAAKHAGKTGVELDLLFEEAFTTSKRVFRETEISRRPVSIPAATVQVARDLHGDLSHCSGLLIGAGEMGEMLATSLLSAGLAHLVVTHPTLTKADSIGQNLNCHVGRMEELPILLAKSDIVLTSMNTRRFTLTRDTIKSASTIRRRKPILIIDTGVPGDVDYAAVELEDAFLYTLDDLEKVTREGVKTREVETNKAWKIVEDEVTNVFTEQEKLVSDNKGLMSNDFIEGLRQKALAEALGDADKATQLFFQSLKQYEKATKALPGVESNNLDK